MKEREDAMEQNLMQKAYAFLYLISAQKVLFLTLFKIGSKYFLSTNHIN